MKLLLTIALVLVSAVANAQFVDRFEYAVPRDAADKAPFVAAGWADVKSEPGRNANGFLYTVRHADLPQCGPSPVDGGDRALMIEALPRTEGGQTDVYLQYGTGSNAEAIPADAWLEWWECPIDGQRTNRDKWFYVTRSPSGYPSHAHDWMISTTQTSYPPNNVNAPAGGHYLTMASADGGATLDYQGAARVGPQDAAGWVRPGRWQRIRLHLKTVAGQPFVMQAWVCPVGGPCARIADYQHGRDGFTWTGLGGGHRFLRWPTTVGSSTGAQPYDYRTAIDNFRIAGREADLPPLDGGGPAPVDCAGTWSAWTRQTGSEGVCTNGSRTFLETRVFTATQQPSGGGLACPASPEMRTQTEPCTVGTPLNVTASGSTRTCTLVAQANQAPGTETGWGVQFSRRLAGDEVWTAHGTRDAAAPYTRSAAVPLGDWEVQAVWTRNGVTVPVPAVALWSCEP